MAKHGKLYLTSSVVTLVVKSFYLFYCGAADLTVLLFQLLFPWLVIVCIVVCLVECVSHVFCSGLDRHPT